MIWATILAQLYRLRSWGKRTLVRMELWMRQNWLPILLIVIFVVMYWMHGRAEYRKGITTCERSYAEAAYKQQQADQKRADAATAANIEGERKIRNATEAAVDAGRDGQRIDDSRVQSINEARAKIGSSATR